MASNMFVQFSNIEGECGERGHKGWCEITKLGQDFSNETAPLIPGDQDNRTIKSGKHGDIKIEKLVDKASLGLMKACWMGTLVPKVVIECFRAGKGLDQQQDQAIKYFSLELENVIIKKFRYAVSEGKLVSEDIELVAAKATYAYQNMHKELGTATMVDKRGITLGPGDFSDSKTRFGVDDDLDDKEEQELREAIGEDALNKLTTPRKRRAAYKALKRKRRSNTNPSGES